MGLLSPILRNAVDDGLVWWCPGCNGAHQVTVGNGNKHPRWNWNSNVNKPTFIPSVKVMWEEPLNLHNPEAMKRDLLHARQRREAGEQNVKVPLVSKVCHCFITNGQIQFLSDCTHPLASQTVDIPPWPRQS